MTQSISAKGHIHASAGGGLEATCDNVTSQAHPRERGRWHDLTRCRPDATGCAGTSSAWLQHGYSMTCSAAIAGRSTPTNTFGGAPLCLTLPATRRLQRHNATATNRPQHAAQHGEAVRRMRRTTDGQAFGREVLQQGVQASGVPTAQAAGAGAAT